MKLLGLEITRSNSSKLQAMIEKGADQRIDSAEFYQALLKSFQGMVSALPANSETYIKQGYAYNVTLYSCINYISRKIAGLEWNLYEVKDRKWLNRYKAVDSSNFAKKAMFRSKALEETTRDPGILRLLNKPNGLQGKQEFMESLIGYLLITGNTYLHTAAPENGANAGIPVQMMVLPSHRTKIKVGDQSNPIAQYIVDSGQGTETGFDPETVCHIKFWNPISENNTDTLYGLSPLRAASNAISVDNDGSMAMVKMLRNMGVVGLLSLQDNTIQFDEKKARNMENKFYQKYGTPKNAGKVWIAPGQWKYEKIGMSPVDLAIIEGKNMTKRDICNTFNMPSVLFNDTEHSTYNNMKEAKKDAWINGCSPHANNLRDELNRFIVEPFNARDGKTYYLDYDELAIPEIQEDTEKLAKTAKEMEDYLTPNEQRAMLGYGMYEGMTDDPADQLYMKTNRIPITGSGSQPIDIIPPDPTE